MIHSVSTLLLFDFLCNYTFIAMNKICRFCITGEGVYNIFREDLEENSIAKNLWKCFNLNVLVNSDLPEFVCTKCFLQLDCALSFKDQCISSESLLHQALLNPIFDEPEVLDVCENLVNSITVENNSLNYCGVPEENNTPLPHFRELCKETRLINSGHHCSICLKSFSTERQLRKHNVVHSDRKFICDVCNKMFYLKSSLKVHLRIHTGESPYLCNVCGKTFKQSTAFKRHCKSHSTDKPYHCLVCTKSFKHKYSLEEHERCHSKEKNYACPTCLKKFKLRTSYYKHIRIHSESNRYKCSVCGKVFSRTDSLSEHMRCHSGEKPFECLECGATFTHRNTLKGHLLIHSKSKPYSCNQCYQPFRHPSSLSRHLKSHSKVSDGHLLLNM